MFKKRNDYDEVLERLKKTNGYKLDKAMREFFAADDDEFNKEVAQNDQEDC